jgi:toluene monooxygenase system ferredoxin subunit
MPFERICSLDDVWEGDMDSFETADGSEVLIVCLDGGEIKAFQGICPHQQQALVEGTFENGTLTCKAHLWQFDCKTGKGVNPDDCRIAEYPVKVIDEEVHVDVFGVEPFKSHT